MAWALIRRQLDPASLSTSTAWSALVPTTYRWESSGPIDSSLLVIPAPARTPRTKVLRRPSFEVVFGARSVKTGTMGVSGRPPRPLTFMGRISRRQNHTPTSLMIGLKTHTFLSPLETAHFALG